MFYDPQRNDHGLPIDPLKAVVAPRPIGWVSTLSADGTANLAPYSFYNLFSEQPTYVAFGSVGRKDSLRNIEATGEFVLNAATLPLKDALNTTSAAYRPAVDEFNQAGLEKAPSRWVRPPRVAACPAALECKLFKILDLPGEGGAVANWMIIGLVVGVYINDDFISHGRVDTAALQLISRLGYADYATADALWTMRRPG